MNETGPGVLQSCGSGQHNDQPRLSSVHSATECSAVQCSAALMACLLAGESAHSAAERPRVEVGVRLLRRHPLRRTLDTHLEGGGRGGEGGEEWEGRRGRGGEGGREEQRRAEVVMPQ